MSEGGEELPVGSDLEGEDADDILARLGEIDAPAEVVDLSEIGDDLKRFQEHSLVRSALSQGVDLRQYAREIEMSLRDVEQESIQDYVAEADALSALHNKIKSCDEILQGMESMLGSFQSDLSAISSEIKHLQQQSQQINTKLRNRKAVDGQLSQFVEQLAVPPHLLTNISDAEVNTAYLEYITTLNNRLLFVRSDIAQSSRARRDVEPVLESLKAKAIGRIREYFLEKIGSLRRPSANIPVIHQTVFSKHRYLLTFLREHSPMVAAEVRTAYVDTVSRVYQSRLKVYFASVVKLMDEGTTKEDMVGASDAVSKSLFTSKHTTRARNHSAFLLGSRDKVVKNIGHPAIVPSTAQQTKQRFPPEEIVRSCVNVLLDTAAAEHHFLVEFFEDRELFSSVFSKSIAFCVESLTQFVANSFDCIAMMLIAQTLRVQQLIVSRKALGGMEGLFDKLSAAAWNQFRRVFELNVHSVRHFAHHHSALRDANPHYVTRRFADLSSSLLLLHQHEQHSQQVSLEADSVVTALSALRSEMDTLLASLSQTTWPRDKRMAAVFMINNLDLIVSVLKERNVTNEEFLAHYEDAKAKHSGYFVEDQLQASFGDLLSFVRANESKVTSPSFEENRAQINEGQLSKLVGTFSQKWKAQIRDINSAVMTLFPDFRNGVNILKQVLGQLVMFYNRLLEIVKRCYKHAPFAGNLVEVSVIMEEIKSYSRSF